MKMNIQARVIWDPEFTLTEELPVSHYHKESETIKLVLETPLKFSDIKPGHAIDIQLPGTEARAYSVARTFADGSEDTDGHATYVVLYIRNIGGQLTSRLAENIELGILDEVTITASYRMFPVDETHSIDRISTHDDNLKLVPIDQKVFVSTGTGIAPFLLYLQKCHEIKGKLPFVITSVKTKEELNNPHGYIEDLLDLAPLDTDRDSWFPRTVIVTTRNWPLQHVTDIMREDRFRCIARSKDVKVYACGFGDMLRDVGAYLINDLKKPAHMFAYESFTC